MKGMNEIMAQDIINANHIVAESTNILSTNFGGGHIYSIVISEDMDNGLLVSRDIFANEEYEDEVWNMKAYAAGDEPLLLLAPPTMPMTELRGYATEDRFYNASGDVVRAYTLRVGDRFSLSEVAFDVAPKAKQYVTFDAAAKQYVVGDAITEGQFCAQVLTVIPRTNMTMYKLQVMSL
jgi:hypothetical protein